MKFAALTAFAATLLAVSGVGQAPDWTQITTSSSPSARRNHAMVYDSVRGKVVMFGGNVSGVGGVNDTWEYDGVNWTLVTTASSPSARLYHAIAYDSVRGKVVMFGGIASGSSNLNDTWEYDGVNWTQVSTVNSPGARVYHAMTYDSVRGTIVLFGGYGSNNLNDTWDYDGVDWTQVTTVISPSSRYQHAMAYDNIRGKVILFGGATGVGYNGDTWEFDGLDWTQVATTLNPNARESHEMAFDSAQGKVILFGGYGGSNGGGFFNDTWKFDGLSWTQITTANSPSARYYHSTAYDSLRGKIVLFGGTDSASGQLNDTWEYDGGTPGNPTAPLEWSNVWTSPQSPQTPQISLRPGHGAVWDSTNQRILGISTGDMWTWDGQQLTTLGSTGNIVANSNGTSLAFHASTASMVCFGDNTSDFTSIYANGSWSLPSLPIRPGTRAGTAMVYDGARDVVVMFGGASHSGALGDTWEFDGVAWSKECKPINPPPRSGHAMAYDTHRGKVVMFGGSDNGYLGDTWEYDGNSWTQITPLTSPPPRFGHQMAYDPIEYRIIMVGGVDASGTWLDDVWSYNGTDWFNIPTNSPGPLYTSNQANGIESLSYDPVRQVFVAACRLQTTGSNSLLDIWELTPVSHPAMATPYGTACGFPALTLTSVDRPIIGSSAVVEMTNAPTPVTGINIGLSNTFSFPIQLPFELTGIGMPGCYMLHSSEAIGLPMTQATAGIWRFSQPIPNAVSLIDQHFYVQGLAYAPGANSLNVITSNGIDWEIGDQ